MKDQQAILLIYRQRIEHFGRELKIIHTLRTRIAWIRFAIVLATMALFYFTFSSVSIMALTGEVAAGLALFLFAVSKDMNAKETAQDLERHIQINEDETAIIAGNYLQRDGGKHLEHPDHSYANDLDIFGVASLYPYINRCTSEQGTILLATRLSQPLAKEEIVEQQDAIQEMADNLKWRQRLQSTGIKSALTVSAQKRLEAWLSTDSLSIYTSTFWQLVSYAFPAISLATCLLYFADVITGAVFYAAVFVFFLFAFAISRKIHPVWLLLSRVVKETSALHQQLLLIEQQPFKSRKCVEIKALLQGLNNNFASGEIRKLNTILNRFDVRLNVLVFYFLNTFLLWDLQQLLALNKWKKNNYSNVNDWFIAIARSEVMLSLATLAFNQPQWYFPQITNQHFTLSGTAIGHPLLPENKRVDSSFNIDGKGKIAIITGSNMGGKSTFLRSIGVNMVLAFTGAPVCATAFTVSVVHLMSSMRVTDNLAESTSTFYAELKKLQTIIKAVKQEDRIFILLDEILRGTNSLDRHTGSAALIKQFIKHKAVAVIATHDVALAELKKDNPNAIANYHFDVQVAGNDLFFDYKLKDGICRSMNASILMKNIGIEMD